MINHYHIIIGSTLNFLELDDPTVDFLNLILTQI